MFRRIGSRIKIYFMERHMQPACHIFGKPFITHRFIATQMEITMESNTWKIQLHKQSKQSNRISSSTQSNQHRPVSRQQLLLLYICTNNISHLPYKIMALAKHIIIQLKPQAFIYCISIYSSTPASSGSIMIRPQYSQTITFLRNLISICFWGGILLKQPPQASRWI